MKCSIIIRGEVPVWEDASWVPCGSLSLFRCLDIAKSLPNVASLLFFSSLFSSSRPLVRSEAHLAKASCYSSLLLCSMMAQWRIGDNGQATTKDKYKNLIRLSWHYFLYYDLTVSFFTCQLRDWILNPFGYQYIVTIVYGELKNIYCHHC